MVKYFIFPFLYRINGIFIELGKTTESIKGPSTPSVQIPSPQPQQHQQLLPAIVALQTEVGHHEGSDLTVKVMPTSGTITMSRQSSKKEIKIEQINHHSISGRIYKTPVRHVSL